jgi:hypothetical protein
MYRYNKHKRNKVQYDQIKPRAAIISACPSPIQLSLLSKTLPGSPKQGNSIRLNYRMQPPQPFVMVAFQLPALWISSSYRVATRQFQDLIFIIFLMWGKEWISTLAGGWLANMRPGQLMAPARIGFEKEGWAFTRTVRGDEGIRKRYLGSDSVIDRTTGLLVWAIDDLSV